MHDPAEPRQPEETEEHEVDEGGDEPTLKQLTEAWDEEAAKGGENVAAGAGAGHGGLSIGWILDRNLVRLPNKYSYKNRYDLSGDRVSV